MKKIHIIAILVIAISLAAVISALSNATTYASFTEASENPGKEYHVVGKLNKNKPTVYNPSINPNLFTFYMYDNKGNEKQVVLHKNKPQDFERSEQIVVIGSFLDSVFTANDILMKCPSKYNDGKPQ